MSSLSPWTKSMGVLAATCGSAIIGAGYMSRMGRYELSAKTPPRLAPVNKTRRQCRSNCPYANQDELTFSQPVQRGCERHGAALAEPSDDDLLRWDPVGGHEFLDDAGDELRGLEDPRSVIHEGLDGVREAIDIVPL